MFKLLSSLCFYQHFRCRATNSATAATATLQLAQPLLWTRPAERFYLIDVSHISAVRMLTINMNSHQRASLTTPASHSFIIHLKHRASVSYVLSKTAKEKNTSPHHIYSCNLQTIAQRLTGIYVYIVSFINFTQQL